MGTHLQAYNSNSNGPSKDDVMMMNANLMEDSGNSCCGSSVVSDCSSGPTAEEDDFDGDGVQVSDLEEGDADIDELRLLQQCDTPDYNDYVDNVNYFREMEDRMKTATMTPPPSSVRTAAGSKTVDATAGAESHQRLAVLSFEQVCRLNDVMDEVVSIHGRGNFPTLEVRLRDLVNVVRNKLEADTASGGAGMRVRDIRLNGGAATYVLASADAQAAYNDLDLIFGVELTGMRNFDRVKSAVLGSLYDMLPDGVSRKRISTCSLKEAYVSKMVKVNNNNDGDRWSLISLGNSRGRGVELKFVDTMRRQFEFSVDSFQIILDSLLLFYECAQLPVSENFYPTVVGESVSGDFQEALYHLHKKLISTRHPEEIRGGGLLKYCNLLVKNYKAANAEHIKGLQKYMCSRFFIDFPDINQQRGKLENYLWNHFVEPEEEALKHQYLMLLHDVVEESTVCLMGHERRQTLNLIKNLAWQVLYQDQQRILMSQQQQQQQQQPPPLVFANGIVYAPIIQTTAGCYCTCNTTWMCCTTST